MNNILGVYARFQAYPPNTVSAREEYEREQKKEKFKEYLWGKDGSGGLSALLKHVDGDYGEDLKTVLFQFNVGLATMRTLETNDLEKYRPKEKAIGAWIAITDENYFCLSTDDRDRMVRGLIIERLEQIKTRFEPKRMNANVEKLIEDTKKVLNVNDGTIK